MRAMGIDIGTTTISVIMIDKDSGKLLGSRSVPHNAFLKGPSDFNRIQDPEKLWRLSVRAAGEIIREYGKPDSIGMTGQMHGVLYVDEEGGAVSPLYTWQDGSGNEFMEDGRTYAQVLREKAGAASAGYGMTTHFYLRKKGMIPEAARKMTTISDYIAMKLSDGECLLSCGTWPQAGGAMIFGRVIFTGKSWRSQGQILNICRNYWMNIS